MNSPEQNQHSQQRLIGDLRLVIENAEELLKSTDQYKGILYQSARAKLAVALNAATEELAKFEDAQLEQMIARTRAENDIHADKTGEERILRAFLN